MASYVQRVFARNLRCPEKGLVGNVVLRLLDKRNGFLESNAARLCRIQPHHKVLEVGFGGGNGLREAYKYVKDGTGMVYGVELSELMLQKSNRRLKHEVQKGKVDISLASVAQLPFNTDTFDRVFHCNCYYFWSDMTVSVQELYRVMKPGSVMVTTMNMASIKVRQGQNLFQYANPDPLRYMWTLENQGFEDVKMEYLTDKDTNQKYEAIFARISEKQAHVEELEEELASASPSPHFVEHSTPST